MKFFIILLLILTISHTKELNIATANLTTEEMKRFKGNKAFSLEERKRIVERINHNTAKLLGLQKSKRAWNNILKNQVQQAVKLGMVNETFWAITLLENALKITEAKMSDNKRILLKLYSDLGSMYILDTQYPKGIKYTKKTIQLYKTINRPPPFLLQASYHYLGFAYRGLGDYQEALKYYQQALSLAKSNPSARVSSYAALADLSNELKDYKKSISYSQKALELTQHNPIFSNATYMNLSYSLLKLKQYKKALQHAKSASNTAKNIWGEEHINMDPYYVLLGVIYTKLEDYDKALSYLKRSINLLIKIDNKPLALASRYQLLSQTYSKIKKAKKAYTSIDKGFTLFNKARSQYFGQVNHFHKRKLSLQQIDFIATLMEVSFETKQGKEKTFNRWLNYKRSIFDIEDSLKLLHTNTSDLKVKHYIDSLFTNQRALARLSLNPPTEFQKLGNYNKKVRKIKEEISKEEIFLTQKILSLDKKAINYQEISTILKSDELYIDFAKMEENYYIFTLNKQNNFTFQKLTKNETEQIDKIIIRIREDAGKHDHTRISQKRYTKLYNLIIKKLDIQNKTSLIISPDGLLGLIPFEAFYDGEHYLVEKTDIRYIPSGKEFVKLYQNKTTPKNQNVVLFSEVDFNKSNSTQTNRGSVFDKLEANWAKLKFSKYETEVIKKVFKENVKYFLENNASEKNLLSVNAPKILHLSTHGFSPKNNKTINPMEKSFILLSGANASIRNERGDGIISGLELAGLNLKGTELVVLSACQTGVGKVEETEGISGLSKAFIKAGAKHIVMSLWNVDDEATSKLMRYFYQNIQSGDNYTIALNKAKRSMIKSKNLRESHPYYWSGFIGSGY
ncbi:MAG: Unknown protein [uncultured Sulfurovum sp.]|uniref:CHAT domain-containing protein n=1 Tax=uncultured Sulfurovum sp. TaxID=269237 RepID=A0A6S6U0H4_9BACT|nr:MAG: Unknown protein [uncultured Sulfurovum sp.]